MIDWPGQQAEEQGDEPTGPYWPSSRSQQRQHVQHASMGASLTLLHVHAATQVEVAAQSVAVAVLLGNPLPARQRGDSWFMVEQAAQKSLSGRCAAVLRVRHWQRHT
jgi:hypothetical protein